MGNWEAGKAPGKESPSKVSHIFWSNFCWELGRKGACFVHAGSQTLSREHFNEIDKVSFLGES